MLTWSLATRMMFDALVAALIGAGFAFAKTLSGTEHSPALLWALFTAVTGIPLAALLHRTLWPSTRLRQEVRIAEHSIETRWMDKASADSFWALAALLVWMDILGRTWGVLPWLAPLTMTHVVIAAMVVLALNYVSVRRSEV